MLRGPAPVHREVWQHADTGTTAAAAAPAMDREKALQYFKQMGFTSTPLQVTGQRRCLSPREMVVECNHEPSTTDLGAKPPSGASRETRTHSRPPLSLLCGEGEGRKPKALKLWTAVAVCSACTCSRIPRSPGWVSPAGVEVDNPASDACAEDGGDGCGYDSDEEGLSLDKLLLMMERLHRRPSAHAPSATLVRLASCFSPPDLLTDQHVNQLMSFLASDHTVVMEMCLKTLERLLVLNKGWEVVQHAALVSRVMDLVGDSPQGPRIQTMAMAVLDKVLNVTELDYNQIQHQLDSEIYPSMLQHLHGRAPLEVKYAACCVVRSLARDAKFAARIKRESLFLLRQLQDSSARLKEVYVGVLMAMFAHPGLTEAGSVDTGVLPVLKGLLRDGPCETQKQALELLQCVMSDDRGVEVVGDDQRMVAYVLACLLTSKCRKVRAQSCLVLTNLTSLHKVSVATSVLEAIGRYVSSQESPEQGAGEGRVTYPVPAKHQADALLWHCLDCFLDSLAGLLRSEGLVSMEMDHLYSELPVKGEISGMQLSCLSHLLQVTVNLCTWPLQRRVVGLGHAQPARLDVTYLCDNSTLRERCSLLNHRLAVQQWNRFGSSIFAILRWMSQRIGLQLEQSSAAADTPGTTRSQLSASATPSRPLSAKSGKSLPGSLSKSLPQHASRPPSAKPSHVMGRELLTEGEWDLLQSLLHFVLCMALVTCKTLTDPLSGPDSPEPPSPEATPPVKKTSEPYGLWVNANPHLTQSRRTPMSLEDMARKQQEDVEKEALSDRRRVRRGLYNEGLFELLALFLQVAVPEVQTMCCLILRTAVQPLQEKTPTYVTSGHSSQSATPNDKRPQSAMADGSRKTEKQINMALHRMSPTTASVVRDALGSRPQSASRTTSEKIPTSTRRPASAVNSLESQASDHTSQKPSSISCQSQHSFQPLVPGQPINRQCQREAAVTCGGHIIQNLFSRSRHIKLYSLVFLYDLIRFSVVPIHMELSRCGVVPKLLDFIRVSDDDEQLEILALRILGLLMSSDLRLQQLFSHHGGHMLLTALARNANANIGQQVKATLGTIMKGRRFDNGSQGGRQRPASAPLHRPESCPADVSNPPRDIWEHIMQRWAQEDQVVKVLQKFM